MLIFSHRGHSFRFVENTIEAFESACKLGFNVELDVCITLDGEIIIKHDVFDEKTGILVCERKYIDGELKLCDLFEKLKKYNIMYIIDLKDVRIDNNDLVNKTLDIVISNDILNKCIFSSFNEFHLCQLMHLQISKKLSIKKAYITGNIDISCFVSKCDIFHIDYIITYKFQIHKDIVDRLHEKNISVISFTCNTRGTLQYLSDCNVDGIITDNLELF